MSDKSNKMDVGTEFNLTKYISNESLKLLQAAHPNEAGLSIDILSEFLFHYVYTIVTNVLRSQDKKDISKQEKYTETKNLFMASKGQIQEAVALAFGKAMSDFSGKNVEYICAIQPMPPSTNKLPC
jgi:hypothetical protein